jgi:CDP-glucose 4,6-dehydratase
LIGKDYSSAVDNPLGQRLRELAGPLLLTGHTGFKGTWMTFLLEYLNIPVVGYSLPPEKGALYERTERTGVIPETFADIRNYETLEKFIDLHKPSTIIHMAAQPLVLKSYESPRETFDINVMGTVNVLDIAFKKNFIQTVIVVTTDKVYRNDNSGRAFVESDPLEGKDPYSASKVGAEAVVAAWQQIARVSNGPRIVSVRAGNVIGGGDFADGRIIPDLIRTVSKQKITSIRNPYSTRPWQHVLDPLVGYILVAQNLLEEKLLNNVNFGPERAQVSVKNLTDIGINFFPEIANLLTFDENTDVSIEAINLQLDSSLSKEVLNWKSKWNSLESIEITFNWWKEFLEKGVDPASLCKSDIRAYFS